MTSIAFPLRTIWVAIRGLNYTDRATRQVGRNIDKLVMKQQEMRRAAVTMIAAGALWVAMAGMAVWSIARIMEASRAGSRMMALFSRSTQRLMRALGDAFVEVLGPAVRWLTALFNAIAKADPMVHRLIAAGAMLVITILALKGVTMLYNAALELLHVRSIGAAIATNQATAAQAAAIPVTQGLTLSWTTLGLALRSAIAPFLLFMTLGMILGREGSKWAMLVVGLAIALWAIVPPLHAAASAFSVLTFGAAALAGLAAMAFMPTYQYGTRFIQRTGPALVHAGEAITPARELRTTPTGEPSYAPFPRTTTNVHLSFGTVQTKADKEQLRPLILKTIKEAMDNKI